MENNEREMIIISSDMENNQKKQYEPPVLIEISEEELPGLEFTNGSTQSMTATMTNCDNK